MRESKAILEFFRDGLDIYVKWEICEYQEHSKVNTNVAQLSLT